MPAIPCPDCKGTVSDSAETCPHCGRPHPGMTKGQVAKMQEDAGCAILLGIVWLAHAAYVAWKWNFFMGVASLFFGPLVWLFR